MEYPKVMYGKKLSTGALVHTTVASREEEDALPPGWSDSMLKLGIETHPQAMPADVPASEPVDETGRPVVDPAAVVAAEEEQGDTEAQ